MGAQDRQGAKKAGPPEFTGAEPCKLTLEMFFDASGAQDGSVVAGGRAAVRLLRPDRREPRPQKKPSPPLVVLHWGSISSFPAFVTSVSAKYTLFSSDGTPIRAACAVAMEEMPGDPSRQNPTSGSRDVRRVHSTVAGDTLASVAYAEYGDPAPVARARRVQRDRRPAALRAGRTAAAADARRAGRGGAR